MLTPAQLRERLEAQAVGIEGAVVRARLRYDADRLAYPKMYALDDAPDAESYVDPNLYVGLGAIYAALVNLKDSQ